MAMPSSGPISLGQTNTERNKSATAEVSLNDADVRTLFDRPSGEISLLHGRGKAWTVDIEYVVVAGAGGGGYGRGGGGGAGGYRTASGFSVTSGTAYTITVGAGGASGTQGSNSVLGSVISTGGGNGWGEYGGTQNNDLDGGSGGGRGSSQTGGNGINDGGTFGTLTYQGHDGGDFCYCGDTHRAGGGGGASTDGEPGTNPGHGGHCASKSITGSVVTIA